VRRQSSIGGAVTAAATAGDDEFECPICFDGASTVTAHGTHRFEVIS